MLTTPFETHRRIAQTYIGTPCDLDTEADWPYDCQARDDHPEDQVVICRNHLVWWHEPKETTT